MYRDFVCNALFYNLQTGLIEDYCGGLDDIANRVLRTPILPEQTFYDDPARMLRGIRFAGQFRFALDTSVAQAMTHPPPDKFVAALSDLPPAYTAPYDDTSYHHPLALALVRRLGLARRLGARLALVLAKVRRLGPQRERRWLRRRTRQRRRRS